MVRYTNEIGDDRKYWKGVNLILDNRKAVRKSPIKAVTLQNPGESVGLEIRRLLVEDFTTYLFIKPLSGSDHSNYLNSLKNQQKWACYKGLNHLF